MTHPLVEVVAPFLLEGEPAASEIGWERTVAARLLLAVLRDPAMREPSEAVRQAENDGTPRPFRQPDWVMDKARAARYDALAREIEEASR